MEIRKIKKSVFFNEEMYRFFDPLPAANKPLSKKTKKKTKKVFGSYAATFMH
jgi:hypothetical protein